jgi:hypothetical protein
MVTDDPPFHLQEAEMNRFAIVLSSASCIVFVVGIAMAGDVKMDTTVSGQRIELHVLPAEPFFTKGQVAAGAPKEGMLIMGGAKPLLPDAKEHPNQHLVIHVFDAKTSLAVTDAKVKMSFQSLDENGNQTGRPIDVPVVVMQAIGKGVQSTHYGNNVVMPDGPLAVSIIVNGRKVKFTVNRLYAPNNSMEDMHMDQ